MMDTLRTAYTWLCNVATFTSLACVVAECAVGEVGWAWGLVVMCNVLVMDRPWHPWGWMCKRFPDNSACSLLLTVGTYAAVNMYEASVIGACAETVRHVPGVKSQVAASLLAATSTILSGYAWVLRATFFAAFFTIVLTAVGGAIVEAVLERPHIQNLLQVNTQFKVTFNPLEIEFQCPRTGFTEEEITERFPLKVAESPPEDRGECAVCVGEITDTQMHRVLPCSHAFHPGCVDRWLYSHNRCPMCNTVLRLPRPV